MSKMKFFEYTSSTVRKGTKGIEGGGCFHPAGRLGASFAEDAIRLSEQSVQGGRTTAYSTNA
jgi:hypothetical protein